MVPIRGWRAPVIDPLELVAHYGSRVSSQTIVTRSFDRSPGCQSWMILDTSGGNLRRIREPSDFLVEATSTGKASNTVEAYASDVAAWFRWCLLTGREALEARTEDMTNWVTALTSTPRRTDPASQIRILPSDPRKRSKSTVARYVTSVKEFYRWAGRNGAVGAHVEKRMVAFRTPKSTRATSVGRLEQGEIDLTYDRISDPRGLFLFDVLYGCGLRIGEALGLRFCDLHFEADNFAYTGCRIPGPHLHVERRDNPNGAAAKGDPRMVPVPPRTIASYRDWMADRFEVLGEDDPSAFVFVALRGKTAGSAWNYRSMQGWWDGCIRTDPRLDRVTRHMVRHTYASELADLGIDSLVIQALLGHRSLSSSDVYTHPGADKLRAAVERRAEWVQQRISAIVAPAGPRCP